MPEDDTSKKEEPDVEKALSFFRIFDLAFFLPGFIIYRFSSVTRSLASFPAPASSADSTPALEIITLVAGSYVLGLLAHAAARLVKSISAVTIEKVFPGLSKAETPSWTASAGKKLQADLRGYFWYTRAVCINLAMALLLVAGGQKFDVACWLIAAAVGLIVLHFEFDRALKGI